MHSSLHIVGIVSPLRPPKAIFRTLVSRFAVADKHGRLE